MPEAIDSETLERACVLMAEFRNEGLPEELQTATPEMFKAYEIYPYDEFLIFSSPGGFSNRIYLVSDPLVYSMAGWEQYEDTIPAARALKATGATRRPPDPDDDGDDDDEDDTED
jgi:hypothetical protein